MWDDLDDAMGRDQAGGDAGQCCVVKSRYVPSSSPRARKRLQEQVYYLQCRDREDAEDEERALFTTSETGTGRPAARKLLWKNRSVKSVCFHRLILSPSSGLRITTVEEAQAWTRSVMGDLGRHLDRDLTWVAAVHRNTGRPHVHVLVSGEAAQPSKAGARRVVRIGAGDLGALRTRIAVDTARPIREAAQARALDAARARQGARRRELDQRLGVQRVPLDTHAASTGSTAGGERAGDSLTTPAPPSQTAPKRRWWRRGG